MLAQGVSTLPRTEWEAFGYCFPPSVMVRHVVQHLAECHAHAVVVVPDTRAYWYPFGQQAIVRSLDVALKGMFKFFSDLTRTVHFGNVGIPNVRSCVRG